MARAVRRLALLLMPSDPDADPARVDALVRRWVGEGRLSGGGSGWVPGENGLLEGGFLRARVERFERVRFVSSGLGGFRVACPVDQRGVVDAFDKAHSAWTAGGPRSLVCGCGATHDLAALRFSPEAGFGRAWLALEEVEGLEFAPGAWAGAEAELGGVRLVARRG